MIYPDVKDLKAWGEANRIPIDRAATCANCKKEFPMNVPVWIADMIGVSTPVHECGENFCTVLLKPRTAKAKEFWGSVVGENLVNISLRRRTDG